MTKPINYQNQAIPPYSGITINITNPMINPPTNHICPPNCPAHSNVQWNNQEQAAPDIDNRANNPTQYGATLPNNQAQSISNQQNEATKATAIEQTKEISNIEQAVSTVKNTDQTTTQAGTSPQEALPQAYPPQYYLNNYNYIQNGEKGAAQTANGAQSTNATQPTGTSNVPAQAQVTPQEATNTSSQIQEEDMNSSKEIINELDARVAEQKELEKNGKQTKVIALTNEYIMSLENYLNNPNTEIRLMAAKEILTRLDEDKNRFDDAALNALLNKMLQDPEKLVRIAALSAFSSQLASGNDFTIQLLTKIQNNPNADKEDVLQAADSLLKMSSRTEIRYTPQHNNYVIQPQAEQ